MSYKLLFVMLAAFAPINHCNNEKLFLQSHRDQILAKLLYKYGIPEEHKSYQEHISETVGKIDVDAATPLDMKRNTGNILHKDQISYHKILPDVHTLCIFYIYFVFYRFHE